MHAMASSTFLPPLTLTVGKAPVYAYTRGQRTPTASHRAVLGLLKKRHERYLAGQRDHHARANLQAAGCKLADALMEPDISNGRMREDTFSFPRQSSRSNLLSDLGCSDLAEHIVHRAKARLRKRHKKRRLLPLRDKAHGQPYSPAGGYSDGETKGSLLALSNTRLCTTAEMHTRQMRTHETRKGHRTLLQKEANRGTGTLTSRHVCPRDQGCSSQLQNARERNLPGSGRLGEFSPEDLQVPKPRQRVVYLSDKQSESTMGVPNAPPTTPATTELLVSCRYIPSLQDLKSQRLLKARLEQISTQLKEKSMLLSQAAQRKEDRKQRQVTARLKAQQRAEIYALNKVMTELEEQKFQALLSAQV